MMYEVWSDNVVEGDWFRGLAPELYDARICTIGRRGTNPAYIEPFITHDRPDIVLVADGSPVLVLEKTREVPTGHNVGQRMARLVRGVELGVPTIKFFPFDARKHGTYTSICNLNARLLLAFERMSDVHDVPMLAVNWPADEDGELRVDGTEDLRVQELVASFLANRLDTWWPEARRQVEIMDQEYRHRVEVFPGYTSPPKSLRWVSTNEYLEELHFLGVDVEELSSLRNRDESLVYVIGMTPDKCRREDPYTGTQFIYDYCWARTGPEPEQKSRNLILQFPSLPADVWWQANPNDPMRKSCNWYLTANALVFSDSVALLRVSRD